MIVWLYLIFPDRNMFSKLPNLYTLPNTVPPSSCLVEVSEARQCAAGMLYSFPPSTWAWWAGLLCLYPVLSGKSQLLSVSLSWMRFFGEI